MSGSSVVPNPDSGSSRIAIKGKFFYKDGQKIWIKGVTYGTFRPDENGNEYKTPEIVDRDFAVMESQGINAIRTYTVPPVWLFNIAASHGLYVMVGIPWEQHVDFLADRKRLTSIEKRVRTAVQSCQRHPSILCYAVGNEIPSPIVRWAGHRRVETFIKKLCKAVREEDPEALTTYVNYPSTEYLDLPFVDLMTFNVYLESREVYERYVARLQNLALDRPLLMAEIGLDSRQHGEEKQANTVDWLVRSSFSGGCAGSFVFAWTDEWHRGGYDIEDWNFGLVDRAAKPKQALQAVREAYTDLPIKTAEWPRISVVVCTHNGSKTIRECLEGLKKVEYPNFEVIIVDDGSTDQTAAIVREYPFRMIQTPNRGLSSARNTGMKEATGEIVAYIDDDAIPDAHWLKYIAHGFRDGKCAAVGGPNILPDSAKPISECVAYAPGNATHVLLSDQTAEHLPGCNLAVCKSAMESIGGFDERFWIAGDDVDACWRLQKAGWNLRFEAGAVVWHYRRDSIFAFWRQQRNYGRAEAMLQRKWPEYYTAYGHARWGGRIYGGVYQNQNGFLGRPRIYHGIWGSAPFQAMYYPEPTFLHSLPSRSEWYLMNLALTILSGLGLLWKPLLLFLPVLFLSVTIPFSLAFVQTSRIKYKNGLNRRSCWKRRIIIVLLNILQPLSRLWGQIGFGLNSLKNFRIGLRIPFRKSRYTLWSEKWLAPQGWTKKLGEILKNHHMLSVPGGDFDRWDFDVIGGLLGHARTRSVVEEHGSGKQFIRLKSWPLFAPVVLFLICLFVLLSVLALVDGETLVPAVLGVLSLALALRAWSECSRALECIHLAALEMGFEEAGASKKPQPQPVPEAVVDKDLVHATSMKLAKGIGVDDNNEKQAKGA